jgi:hypothetical protein
MNMDRQKLPVAIAVGLVIALAGDVFAQSPSSAHTSETAVYRFSDLSAVDGSYSRLVRGNGIISMELATNGLEPDAPYTTWWVIFNTPEGCYADCDLDDLFNPDGTLNLNPSANISMLFADGAMTDAEGRISFSAILPAARALGEVLVWSGVVDVRKAEVHLVVRAHGPLEPGRAYEQLSTFEPHPILGGTCALCEDVQFTVHLPVTARANQR